MIRQFLSMFFYKKYNQSFSQGGEDAILKHLFSNVENGTFVDIGAFHPYMFSNTYVFYKKGWRGINIDAAPGSMDLFNKWRKGDTNLEFAIGENAKELSYYYLGEHNPMNTFSYETLVMLGMEKAVKKTIPIITKSLADILDTYGSSREIDFFSIDVEGLELTVLKSNDWSKYRPKVILLESFEQMNEQNNQDSAIGDFLKGVGYRLFIKTHNAIFFVKNELTFTATNKIN